MQNEVTYKQVMVHAKTKMGLARVFDIKRQAVQQWEKHGIPKDRQEELKRLRPEWFKSKRKEA